MGFDGCLGSSDGTHIPLLSCPTWASNSHKGHELNCRARTFNVTVTHARQILSVTQGYPSTWNDKTLIMMDEFYKTIKSGKSTDKRIFELYKYNDKFKIIKVKYAGAWFIVDNGYLEWSCTIPPMKNAINYKFIRFLEWLESMQKDVKCAFGILKGRFTILKTGVRMQSLKKVDQLFRTCCAIHNCLLFVDGLDKGWEDGVQSYWEQQEKNIKSFPLQRLNRIYNQNSSSSIINDKMLDYDKEHLNKSEKNGVRYVKKYPLIHFINVL